MWIIYAYEVLIKFFCSNWWLLVYFGYVVRQGMIFNVVYFYFKNEEYTKTYEI